ncbi:MAG TPA: serine/threonine-protein kinase [Planctomycetota bacterium]|nr:serine/threonine-protein kinase [Planctomycetota bacterium]
MAAVRTIGDYELLEELGAGGMGRVYRARHARTGALRALKVMTLAPDEEAIARFEREKEILARVGGRGVVPIHDSGMERGHLWFSMALVEGGSLASKLKAGGKLPWRDAARLVREVALVLARCHAAGVVHRDVKPDNVLLDTEGSPWLADFGCVRATDARQLTVTGELIGTISYMSPEQLKGESVDGRTDVFALAAVLHELVTGDRLFPQRTPVEQLMARKKPPRALAPLGAPDELDGVLERALAFAPEQRTASAETFAGELDLVLRGAGVSSAPGRPSRLGVFLALGLVLLGAAAVGGGYAASRHRKKDAVPENLTPLQRLLRQGDVAMETSRFAEAEAAFTEALPLATRREEVLLARGRAAARAGDEARALEDFGELWPRLRTRDPKACVDFAPLLYRLATAEGTAGIGTALEAGLAIDAPPHPLASRVADLIWEQAEHELQGFDPMDPAAKSARNRDVCRRTGVLCKKAFECDPTRIADFYCSRMQTLRPLIETGASEPSSVEALFTGWPEQPLALYLKALEKARAAQRTEDDRARPALIAGLREYLEKALDALPPRREGEHPELGALAARIAEQADLADAMLLRQDPAMERLVGRCAARSCTGLGLIYVASAATPRQHFAAAEAYLDMALLLPPVQEWKDFRANVAARRLRILSDQGRYQDLLACHEELDCLPLDPRKYQIGEALYHLGRFQEVLDVIPYFASDTEKADQLQAQVLRLRCLQELGRGDEVERSLEEARRSAPHFGAALAKAFGR